MNKLRESRETVVEAERLIDALWRELEKTRILLQRMIDRHGNIAQGGEIVVPTNREFFISAVRGDDVEIRACETEFACGFDLVANRYHELMEGK